MKKFKIGRRDIYIGMPAELREKALWHWTRNKLDSLPQDKPCISIGGLSQTSVTITLADWELMKQEVEAYLNEHRL